MADKKVLNEEMVRRFMKLSGQKNLTDPFLKRMLNESQNDLQQMPASEQPVKGHSKLGVDESLGMPPMAEDDDKDADDMGMPPSAGPEAPEMGGEEGMEGGREATVEQLVQAIAQAIQQVSGVQVSVAGGGEGGPPVEEPPGEGMGSMGDESGEVGSMPPTEEPEDEEVKEAATLPATPPAVREAKELVSKSPESWTNSKNALPDSKLKKTPEVSQPDFHGLKVPSSVLQEGFIKEVAKRVSQRLMTLVKESKKSSKKTSRK